MRHGMRTRRVRAITRQSVLCSFDSCGAVDPIARLVTMQSRGAKLASPPNYRWSPGSTIRIAWLNGEDRKSVV